MNMHSFGDASKSDDTSSSKGADKHQGQQPPGIPLTDAPLNLDTMLKDPAFHGQLEMMAEHMDKFADKMKSNPRILERAKRISNMMWGLPGLPPYEDLEKDLIAGSHPEEMEAMIKDPDLQSEAESIATYVEQVKGSTDPGVAQEIADKMDAVLANPKFRGKASQIILGMLSADLMEHSGWLEDVDLEELANAVQDPSTELVAAMEEVRRAKANPAALLQIKATDKEEKADFGPLTMARGRTSGPIMGGRRAAQWPRSWRSSANLGVTGPGPVMSMETELNPQSRIFQENSAGPTGAALTSAKGIRSMMPSLIKALPRRGVSARAGDGTMSAADTADTGKRGPDVALLLCFALWYLGNYNYNIANKLALVAGGGAAGFPMTIATLQLGVGVIYALFMWIAPDARKRPNMSFKDYVKTLPVGITSAGAHAASVFALGAGSVSFAQIVKASEPAFAAAIGTMAYR